MNQAALERFQKLWEPMRYHETQQLYVASRVRFTVVPAGRRSGKTHIAKRRLVKRAIASRVPGHPFYCPQENPRFFAGAPTRDQAKRIFWNDLKRMFPPELIRGKPSESELTIPLATGAEVVVLGMDKPERIEGSPWNGGVLDEIANIKGSAWGENVRPALSDRQGWCDLIGVPEGRNHYYDMAERAKAERDNPDALWTLFHWKSAEILPAAEIEAAREDLDELTFQQEYEASFVNFSGRAYYGFDSDQNCMTLPYNEWKPLILCFDFNVDPGVAVVAQEMSFGRTYRVERHTGAGIVYWEDVPLEGTGVIGEVHIEKNSNTPMVCRKLLADWGNHKGRVRLYGDATGGARGTAKVAGSDWEIIQGLLRPVFGDKLEVCVPRENPPEKVRLNAMNSRLCSAAGLRRLMVDRKKAPYLVRDLDGVRLIPGSNGEIDKKTDEKLTHLTDALGYYVVREFPVSGRVGSFQATVTGL